MIKSGPFKLNLRAREVLKNGVKIIVKPTQLKADEVLLQVQADGGMSQLADTEVKEGEFLPVIAAQSGGGQILCNRTEQAARRQESRNQPVRQ